jgi:hypothetical protein
MTHRELSEAATQIKDICFDLEELLDTEDLTIYNVERTAKAIRILQTIAIKLS